MITRALRGQLFGRLGVRLLAAVALALTPLALLAFFQTEKFESEAQARWQTALFGETLLAATPQIAAINLAKGLAAATATTVRPIIDDSAACVEVMRGLVASEPLISFAGFIQPDGKTTCASIGVALDFGLNPALVKLNADPKPMMKVNPKGPVSGESVLIFSHPVFDEGGEVLGYVSLSLPHRVLEHPSPSLMQKELELSEPLALITFDGEGTVLTTIYGIETIGERLPVGMPLVEFVDKPPATFMASTPLGDRRTFTVVPIVPGTLYVLASWPAVVASSSPLAGLVPLWVFPFAMWLASLLVAWLTAEYQVLRHVRALRASIIAFADGSRIVKPPDLSLAPNELRDVGKAYERMMSSVMHDEAELENSLHQKEVLLREVHHRVKNNLQLIASIMNLQMRKSVAPEARQLLKGLHDRVMSLAIVHRELYQTSGLTDVLADELLQTIVAQVVRGGASDDRQIETKTSFDRIRMTPDQAVPLSLILTEALTNALKHSGQNANQKTLLTVSFHEAGAGRAALEVVNTMSESRRPTLSPDPDNTGLGQQLLSAFATQLSGTLNVGERDGSYFVRIDFPLLSSHDALDADASAA